MILTTEEVREVWVRALDEARAERSGFRPFGLSRRVCQHIGTKRQISGRLTRSGPDLIAREIYL